MFSEETSVFSVECYFAMFSDIAKTGSGSSRALASLSSLYFLYLTTEIKDLIEAMEREYEDRR